ncbi:MAG: CapA family protein, partial [Gemmatimonadaceae bacterium]
VVVSIHWGTELQDWPSESQRAAATWLVEHGADVVIGHHPHVVQDPQCVHGRPVFYSLGNHVFDQRYPETKDGLIADCRIHGARLRCGGVRTHTRRGSSTPVVVSGGGASLDACPVDLTPSLAVQGFSIRPRPWSPSTSDSALVLEGWKKGAVQWRTRPVQLVSLQPGLATKGGTPLLLALEQHPSTMDHEVALRPHVYDVGPRGLIARWRGTALAWPLVDAFVDDRGRVCALHRGDSFIRPDPTTRATRTMRYEWNGFGFSAIVDSGEACAASLRSLTQSTRRGE